LGGAQGYDVVFCRNVLIYFDRVTQRRAIEVLGRLLKPSGLLFVGPSESALLLDQGFVTAGIPLAFAFRRTRGSAPPRPPRPAVAVVPAKPVRAIPRKAATIAAAQPMPSAADKTISTTEQWLEQARRFANQGQLVEALKCCERHLHSQPASAEGFHLAGLLHDAAGRVSAAAEHYRKALYLDPSHPEALVHLAVALQKEGNARGAQRLFERANRRSAAGESKGGR
jgi:chemotaxis protein methyltransferase WspC